MFEFLKRLLQFGGASNVDLLESRAEQNHLDYGLKRLRAASFDLGSFSTEIWQTEIGGFIGAAGVSSLACCCKSWRDRIVHDEILWRGLCEVLWRGSALGRCCPLPTNSMVNGSSKSNSSSTSSSSTSCSTSIFSNHESAHPSSVAGSDDSGSENPLFGQWALCRCSRTPLDRGQAVLTTLPLPRALAQRTAARRSLKRGGVREAAGAAATAGSQLDGENAASAASGEALLDVVCEEVRLLSYRESYFASLRDRRRTVPLDVDLVELSWRVRYFSFPFGIFALHQDARPWAMVFDATGFYGEGLYFDASAGARWGIEADGTVAYLPVGFRQALARTPQWGWQYANRVGRIDATGTLRQECERPPLLFPSPQALPGDRENGEGDRAGAAAGDANPTAAAAAAGAAESVAPTTLGAAAAAAAHGDGFTPAFRAKLAYNRALFGADLPLLSLYRALTGT